MCFLARGMEGLVRHRERKHEAPPMLPRTIPLLPVALIILGCSSGDASSSTSSTQTTNTTKANPCATPGSTYELHFVEQSGGRAGSSPMRSST